MAYLIHSDLTVIPIEAEQFANGKGTGQIRLHLDHGILRLDSAVDSSPSWIRLAKKSKGRSGSNMIYPLVMTNIAMENPNHKWWLSSLGKSSISMGHLYHGYVSHNQRVDHVLPVTPSRSPQSSMTNAAAPFLTFAKRTQRLITWHSMAYGLHRFHVAMLVLWRLREFRCHVQKNVDPGETCKTRLLILHWSAIGVSATSLFFRKWHRKQLTLRRWIHGAPHHHWIGLRENLQETMDFTIKYRALL